MSLYKSWGHVFKLDPNRPIGDDALEQICESGTDAVVVGGTDGVTLDNTLHLLSRIRQYSVDCALEISNLDAVTPGFDFYFVPTVLNAQDPKWIVGHQQSALKEYGHTLDWEEIAAEGYIVLNPKAKVAELTKADTSLDGEAVAAYAQLADQLFHLPILYLEYSGTYGSPELVKKVKQRLKQATLFYGGGISSSEQAEEMANWADVVIVGNLIYEDLKAALKTVKAVQDVKKRTEGV
ncbi:heptaprenylglyceryl phosphate synthase [Pullulanibacillus sp. KACC 23026]|uniref:heptaprenylglyceryl phosphate synthase n=1 Tax=Pullulanibacillus sp. KACC 23026 TaxID=3028315 RepID=UPI0023AF672E|nr:heptaprenylglyceryl phosphate synthase [Pullulanibacillus sp. KACC 23026]WEG12385.1 heptaprenylglyceryl phosphate synthase [Pullulanibacillus sp. KACC 23026]